MELKKNVYSDNATYSSLNSKVITQVYSYLKVKKKRYVGSI